MTKPARPAKAKIDLYAEVTDKMIAALEQGQRPWSRPWKDDGSRGAPAVELPLRVTGAPYTGINTVMLWYEAQLKGYVSPTWMTFNQAKKLGATVRGGEKGATVIYASKFAKEVEDKKGETKTAFIPFLKGYKVFNCDQIDGLPERFAPKPYVAPTPSERLARIAHCEEFFAKTGSDVRHGGNRAFYSPGGDFIQLPNVDAFKDIESYYATSGHEHVHWTGSDKRLKREFGGRFGNDAYAAEELVAELGSAFLCAYLGLAEEPREDHAQYLANWLRVLKGDKKFIVTAASLAQKGVEHLRVLAGEPSVKETEDSDEAETPASDVAVKADLAMVA